MQVRALAGWPGTVHNFLLRRSDSSESQLALKILSTRLTDEELPGSGEGKPGQVQVAGRRLFVRCGDGAVLELLQVQPAGKAAMAADAFVNGLSSARLLCQNGLQI